MLYDTMVIDTTLHDTFYIQCHMTHQYSIHRYMIKGLDVSYIIHCQRYTGYRCWRELWRQLTKCLTWRSLWLLTTVASHEPKLFIALILVVNAIHLLYSLLTRLALQLTGQRKSSTGLASLFTRPNCLYHRHQQAIQWYLVQGRHCTM